MDILSWSETKLHEAAVIMGFVAVVNVAFLSPVVTVKDTVYTARLSLSEGFSTNMEALLDNSVQLGSSIR